MEQKVLALADELRKSGHEFLIIVAKDGELLGSQSSYTKKSADAILKQIAKESEKLLKHIMPV